ncbi:MAG: type IV pilus modification protein PilV [Acidiferrobacterales bacterium]
MTAHSRQSGFSLIEVLVALLVLSIGLLGLAGLQVFSLRFNHQSYERTQATMLMYDMIDRMRANPLGTVSGDYSPVSFGSAYTVAASCPASCSNPSDMAKTDLAQWKASLANLLSQGQGSIVQVAGGTSLYTLTVQWTEQSLTMQQSMTVQVP